MSRRGSGCDGVDCSAARERCEPRHVPPFADDHEHASARKKGRHRAATRRPGDHAHARFDRDPREEPKTAFVLVICTATACGSSAEDQTGAANPEASSTAQASPIAEATSPLVGLWQRDNTCQEITAGLEEAGPPHSMAPGFIADNGYVSGSVEQLAKKGDPGEGARPLEDGGVVRPYPLVVQPGETAIGRVEFGAGDKTE